MRFTRASFEFWIAPHLLLTVVFATYLGLWQIGASLLDPHDLSILARITWKAVIGTQLLYKMGSVFVARPVTRG